MAALPEYVTPDLLDSLAKYLRLTDYIAAAQLYLKDNFLLEQELTHEHVKKRILGHWGTVPGLNFIYACLNIIIKQYSQEMMVIFGPGHGYPSLLANLYVEGSLGEFYPEFKISKESFGKLIHNFSWPGGFPSHANPETPGAILEGGELGYSLATAFGAAFDNPELIVACVVGDGEAETGPTATAWHSNKFINPAEDGAVLPIVHINSYKISGPTIYGTMDDIELTNLFRGYGYEPLIVEGDFLYEPMLSSLDYAYKKIKDIQQRARNEERVEKPAWPVILLRSKKGWTGPREYKGLMIEDSFRSHGIPLEKVNEDEEQFQLLKEWLESYKVNELFTDKFELLDEIKALIPEKNLCMGMSKHTNGGSVYKQMRLPNLAKFEQKDFKPGKMMSSNMELLGEYLRDVTKLNPKTFRLMSPDETESNKLGAMFEVTKRRYMWPVPKGSENLAPDGRVMEILSEHTLQGWMQGYILTGRNSVFISYEAFVMIIASMVDQYNKFLKQMAAIKWREDLPSMNIILTSTSWRQEHNGFSHQNPGFISSVLNDYTNNIKVYFPVDANMLLVIMEQCFQQTNTINVIVVEKRGLPQYLTIQQAKEQMKKGVSRWEWAGNDDENPDVVFAASGDSATQESIAAIYLLREALPELKTRFISVTELSCFGIGENYNLCTLDETEFAKLFTQDKEIIFSYHGYPEDIQHLIFKHHSAERFHIHGYIEQGTTTTPFDMKVRNKADRYTLAIEAIQFASKTNNAIKAKSDTLIKSLEAMLEKHYKYIEKFGVDMPEIENFKL